MMYKGAWNLTGHRIYLLADRYHFICYSAASLYDPSSTVWQMHTVEARSEKSILSDLKMSGEKNGCLEKLIVKHQTQLYWKPWSYFNNFTLTCLWPIISIFSKNESWIKNRCIGELCPGVSHHRSYWSLLLSPGLLQMANPCLQCIFLHFGTALVSWCFCAQKVHKLAINALLHDKADWHIIYP